VSAGLLASPLALGHYPTPVERIDVLGATGTELWVKRDDRTHDVYGGNKVRKLEWLLADARARGARRLVTVGAAGSHHVLATTYFGRREGFEVEAVLVPQPRTDHVVEVLRAGVALGLHAIPVQSWASAAWAMATRMATTGKDTRLITVGGSSVVGAMGYVAAARELAAQVRAGVMPEPDVCIVALGSGGTAAGLASGLAAERMKTRVVGVCVSEPPWALRIASRRLARACARRIPFEEGSTSPPRLDMDTRFLGRGYGHSTAEGDEATQIARASGLVLDPTYTAKAFASALWHVRARQGRVILYWHTLSSAPMGPLLARAPNESELDPRLRGVLIVASVTG
jgi:1-aminocyclopropane-1-carboxylate deaminase/D-cysteine desulfhydrase-like pyridoxal-dependent ACC family enzyme